MSARATAPEREPARLRAIGRTADIPYMEGRRVIVDGEPVAVFNTGSGFAAIGGACPHRGGPLSDGLLADGCVTCPLHGWRIDLGTGEATSGGEGSVAVHEIVERGGVLYLGAVGAAETERRRSNSPGSSR